MLKRDDKVSAWQTGILLFVVLFANKILVLPSLVYQKTNWFVFFVFGCLFMLELLLVCLFLHLKKQRPNESFFDIIKERFGRISLVIFCVVVILFFFAKCVLLYNIVHMFLRSVMYRKGADILFLICFLPVSNFLAFSGVKALGRTAQIFFPFIVIVLVCCVIIGSLAVKGGIIFSGIDFGTFVKGLLRYVGPFGDSLFLFVFMDKVKIEQGQFKVIVSFAILSAIFVVLICIIFVLTYSYTAFLHPFAIFEMLSFVKEYEGLGRLDVIPVVVVMFLTFFQLAIYLKSIFLTTEKLFFKCREKYSIFIYNLAFVLVVETIVTNLSGTIWCAENILPFLSIVPFAFVPICAVFSKRRKR